MTGELGKRERLDELLVKRSVEGLDTPEAFELEALLAEVEVEGVDPFRFDEAAAQFWLAAGDPEQPLPGDVAGRVEARLSASGEADEGADVVPLRALAAASAEPAAGGRAAGRRGGQASGSRWAWLATAAALVLAVVGWWPESREAAAPRDLVEARDRLVAEAPDAVRLEWDATDHELAEGVSGYVVWSDQEQQGYMTFSGIPRNDPSEHQYQLWVFDDQRREQYPVDGGVFDAPADRDEVVIPIEPRLAVHWAKLFAVTLEPPGGVVVSERDPILWLAQRDPADCPAVQEAEEPGI